MQRTTEEAWHISCLPLAEWKIVMALNMYWCSAHRNQFKLKKKKMFYLNATHETLENTFPPHPHLMSVSMDFRPLSIMCELTQAVLDSFTITLPWPIQALFLIKIQQLYWFTSICWIKKSTLSSSKYSAFCFIFPHWESLFI